MLGFQIHQKSHFCHMYLFFYFINSDLTFFWWAKNPQGPFARANRRILSSHEGQSWWITSKEDLNDITYKCWLCRNFWKVITTFPGDLHFSKHMTSWTSFQRKECVPFCKVFDFLQLNSFWKGSEKAILWKKNWNNQLN